MDAQIKKGILEMCLLHRLAEQDYYGYHLMQEMKKIFPEVNDSTFYSILRRLYKEGDAMIYEGEQSDGPKRKYYRITGQGKESLRQAVSDWKEIKEIVDGLGIGQVL